jgi:hypothetical protein
MRAAPSLAFPVSGRDARAVGGHFGDPRGGGAREHQGIDIFAPRGTPALAATGGVAWSGSNELGGNVVWLRDGDRGLSLYYAHLDRVLVEGSRAVQAGDTLGLVGTTGNARATAPHLHFGVYAAGGPIDPRPFVETPPGRPAAVTADVRLLGDTRRTTPRATPLLAAPDAGSAAARRLQRHTVLRVHGASGRYHRVALPDGTTGYVGEGAHQPVAAAVRRLRIERPLTVHDRPQSAAAVLDRLDAGEGVAVLGVFENWLMVPLAPGRHGWLAPGASS